MIRYIPIDDEQEARAFLDRVLGVSLVSVAGEPETAPIEAPGATISGPDDS